MAQEVMARPLVIDDRAFAYLAIQRGAISDLRHDRAEWERAYCASLAEDYLSMIPYLPAKCSAILDVGGGMGGIDILLSRHYGGKPAVLVLDGITDEPNMQCHYETFSNATVASEFMFKNGVLTPIFITPPYGKVGKRGNEDLGADLVISTQAWCFHFNPESYLPFVKSICRPGATLILDVRRDYATWIKALKDAFTYVGVDSETAKSLRMVFRA